VLLSGAIAIQLGASDPARVVAAAAALGLLLDGAIPTALEEWDVPPDAVARACDGLRTLATRPDAPVAARLAALDAIAATMVSCGPADVSGLAHDPAPAIRRAAVLVAAAARREQVVVGAISDGDRGVSGAATASACRVEGRTPHTGRTQPPPPPALAAARTLAGAPGTAADDAVEMLDCLAAGGTPADRAQLDELQRRPPSPLRDRAVELAGARDSAQ
jgi:hypothetical protein